MSSIQALIQNMLNLPHHLNCNYYTTSEFQNQFNANSSCHELTIFHVNIQSLNAHNHSLVQLMESLTIKFDIIILSEIWSYNIDLYSNLFPNYNFIYSLPLDSNVGGVGHL